MKQKVNYLFKNEMIVTSFYTGIGTVIAQFSGLVVSKIIAVALGTSGVAMVSQFIDFITMSTSIATGSIQHGVVKYVAEFKNNREELAKVFSTSLRITLFSGGVLGVLIFIFSDSLSYLLFQKSDYIFVLRIFAVNIVLFGLNTLLIKILNGLGEIKKLVSVTISNSLFGLFITSSAAYFFGLKAALIALSFSQSVVLFISLLYIKKSDWFNWKMFKLWFDKTNVIRFLKFTLMGICLMVFPPLVNIGIRNYIIDNLSEGQAGICSGLWKISNSYLSIITLTLSYYYLPKLSNLTDKSLIRREIINGYKILLPALFTIIVAIYVLKENIILLVYTNKFLEMKPLFTMQLIGDFFKIAAFLLSYLMLAKAKTVMFIVTTVIFSFSNYMLSVLLLSKMGLKGIAYSHAIQYGLYLLTMIYLLRDYIYEKHK
ncbi:MAG: O-antigen translocase [Bacteroidales bacterium]|nr:O-antigen translocase [Bacteroidales bacterium]